MDSSKQQFTKAIKLLEENFDFKVSQDTDSRISLLFVNDKQEVAKSYLLENYKSNSSFIGHIALEQKQSDERFVVFGDYIPPKVAEKFRELDIAFFDANGNIYFNEPEFYIFVSLQVNKFKKQKSNPSLIFQKGGLQILFVLLSIPESENKPYREIAEMSGVSLGTVSEVLKELSTENYLVKTENQRKLFRKDELLKRWVQEYSEKIAPKLSIREFSAKKENWWKKADLTKTKSCWGGEVATNLLTKFIEPTEIKIYAENEGKDLIKKYRLRKENGGNVKIIQKFWNFESENSIAPPLLIYADLLATAKARNIEAAQIIYDEYLAGLIK